MFPFFAGLLLSRLHISVSVPCGGFAIASAIVAATLAMPYFAAPDDCPAKEVVAAVPEVLNTNNFNQIYYRARCALAEAALQPGSVLAEMCCA